MLLKKIECVKIEVDALLLVILFTDIGDNILRRWVTLLSGSVSK